MDAYVINAAVQSYLGRLGRGEVLPSDEGHELMMKELAETMKPEHYSSEFRLRLSSLGKPLCQTIAEMQGWDKVIAEPQIFPMRLATGNLLESYVVMILRESGLPVEGVQVPTTVKIGDANIRGTCDIVIGGVVYDIKTASDFSFKKFKKGFLEVVKDDPFGYAVQGFMYARGLDMPFGGWIIANKNSGEIYICGVPDDQEDYMNAAFDTAFATVAAVTEKAPFVKMFEDEPEVFYRKPTGNRKLGVTCRYCPFRYTCWDNLITRSSAMSTAMNPPTVDYTVLSRHKVKDENGNWIEEDVE